jgi:Asp/Glu/hydantoin racemase
MIRRVVFVHTVLSVVPQFIELARELLPAEVETWHIADELLAKVAVAQGGLSPFIYDRVAGHARAAREAGAGLVQLTCSSISPCAGDAAAQAGIPVLLVDEPMADRAITLGRRVGVAATAPTALGPTTDLIRRRARAAGLSIEVRPVLCEAAYVHLSSGNLEEYNAAIRRTIAGMVQENDVIVLAQASMAGAVQGLTLERPVPILTSPRLAVERLASLVK